MKVLVEGQMKEGQKVSLVKEGVAAEMLGVSPKTLQRWRWAGKGPPFVKVGAAVRYDQDDVEHFINEGRRRSTSSHSVNGDKR